GFGMLAATARIQAAPQFLEVTRHRRRARIHQAFIAALKRSLKHPADDCAARKERGQGTRDRGMTARKGEANMARFEIAEADAAAIGIPAGTDVFFELGMMYSTGRSVPTDLVTA